MPLQRFQRFDFSRVFFNSRLVEPSLLEDIVRGLTHYHTMPRFDALQIYNWKTL